jgi:hypothetical protein
MPREMKAMYARTIKPSLERGEVFVMAVKKLPASLMYTSMKVGTFYHGRGTGKKKEERPFRLSSFVFMLLFL